jgi:hypothetical protein
VMVPTAPMPTSLLPCWLQTYPIHDKNTFRPSGNPVTDPPERQSVSELEWTRRILGIDTQEGMRVSDRGISHLRGPKGLTSKERGHRGHLKTDLN